MPVFEKRTLIAATAARVFAFHERPDAFELLQPPGDGTTVVEKSNGIDVGARVVVDTKVGPFTQRIVAVHTKYEAGRMFQDRMERGPFARWEHTHLVEPDASGGAWLIDHIEYELPLGALGQLGGGWFVRRKLAKMFEHRHAVTKKACEEKA